mmetsp:Transcript_121163/g.354095  ORF Transcript_121163/g.354095 Transcript_121163/m.354095 type:complete len:225 (-) Transcript_121163:1488-2162(-)
MGCPGVNESLAGTMESTTEFTCNLTRSLAGPPSFIFPFLLLLTFPCPEISVNDDGNITLAHLAAHLLSNGLGSWSLHLDKCDGPSKLPDRDLLQRLLEADAHPHSLSHGSIVELVSKDRRDYGRLSCPDGSLQRPNPAMVDDRAALRKEPLMRDGVHEANVLPRKHRELRGIMAKLMKPILCQYLSQLFQLCPPTNDHAAHVCSFQGSQGQAKHPHGLQALCDH